MTVLLQIAIVVGSVLGLLCAIKAIKVVGTHHDWKPEVQRKGVHICTGLYAMALPFLFQDRWPVVLLIVSSIAVMLVLRLPFSRLGGLGSTLHGVERKSYGDLLLALAIGFVFLRSTNNLILYTLPIAVLTLSDAAAALAGSTYGRRLFQVESGTKSWEGVTIFFLVTWIVSMVMLLLFTDVPRINVVILGVTIAVFGAIVEADSWRGFDNLFVPIGIHFFLQGHLATHPLELAIVAVTFIAALSAVMTFAPMFRLSDHAARGYVVAVFLICGISEAQNAILPVLVLFSHLVARSARPCRSPYPELDLLAMTSGTALVWLIVGESIGPSAINLFNLTFAGAIAVYLVLACRGRVAAAGGIILLLVATHYLVIQFNPPEKHWHGPLLPIAFLSIGLCTAIAVCFPVWFDRWRAPRAIGLGAAVPFVTYLFLTLTR